MWATLYDTSPGQGERCVCVCGSSYTNGSPEETEPNHTWGPTPIIVSLWVRFIRISEQAFIGTGLKDKKEFNFLARICISWWVFQARLSKALWSHPDEYFSPKFPLNLINFISQTPKSKTFECQNGHITRITLGGKWQMSFKGLRAKKRKTLQSSETES